MQIPRSSTSLVLVGALLAELTAQSVPGFLVETHATLEAPYGLDAAPDGTLYAGWNGPGPDVHAVWKIAPDGTVSELGPSNVFFDPDTVLYDGQGAVSGEPGAVLVAGGSGGSSGTIWAVRPDGSWFVLFGPTPSFTNPADMALDSVTQRFVLADDFMGSSTGHVLVSDLVTPPSQASLPVELFALSQSGMGDRLGTLAVDDQGVIFTGAFDGVIRKHAPDGSLLDGSFAAGMFILPPIAIGPGTAAWGTDLYAVKRDTGELYRIDAGGAKTVIGTGFTGDALDMVFGPSGALYISERANDRILRIAPSAWSDQGCALAGVMGDPLLQAEGTLIGSSVNTLDLSGAAGDALAALVFALSGGSVPFKGGTLKPFPFFPPIFVTTGPAGDVPLVLVPPPGLPQGTEVWFQWAIQDAAAIFGVSLSNAVRGITP